MSPRLRIAKGEVLRILTDWHRRLGERLPELVDSLEGGQAAFDKAWGAYVRDSMADVLVELEASADDAPRAV